jgi:hypothetical protein
MTLQSRLADLVAAIGADIKDLRTKAQGPTPYYLAQGETYSVPPNRQALFSTTIDNEGFLDVEGLLEEV